MIKKLLVGLILAVFLVGGVTTPLLATSSFLWAVEETAAEHSSHSHTFSFSGISNPNHTHGTSLYNHSTADKCDSGGVMNAHNHHVSLSSNSGSNHSTSGSTESESASDLNHTHTVSGTLSSTGSHTHTISNVYNDGCNYVNCSPEDEHDHNDSTSGTYSSNGSHSHTFTGETGTGTGTLASHTHSVDLTSVSGGSHTHGAGSAQINSTTDCHLSNDHGHDATTTSSSGSSHTQGVAGDTELAGETPPTVTTQAVSAITDTTATGNGNITDIGSESCDKRGMVYGTTSKGDPGAAAPPGGYDAYAEDTGTFGTGAFTKGLTSLNPGQIYYVRAYAHNVAGYDYGGEVNFYTLPGNPSNLTATTVSDTQIDLTWTKGTGGDKTMVRRAEGAYPANPAAGDQVYFDTGVAHSDTGRDPTTLYYYRAWAYDTEGAQYSSGYASDTATTLGPPTVTTNAATLVEETTATLNGEITALNNGNATTRGFEWDTDSGAPYANDWYGEGEFGLGVFDHGITGLTKGELYYYRAYATNTYGMGYGSEVTFLTKPDEPNTLDAVVGGATQVDLTWVKGTGAQKTYIRGEAGSYPTDRTDGYEVYNDTGTNCSDTGMTPGYVYYYRAWSYATEGGKEQYSDLYDQDSVIVTLGLELWYQPETIISGTTLVDRQGDYDGTITWGGRLVDSGSLMTLTDSELVQADDYWNEYTLKVKDTTDDLAPEGEEAEILDFTSATLGGTADSGNTTTLVDAALVQTTAYWAGATVTIVTTTDSGAPQGESKTVTTWDLPTTTLTFPAMTAGVDTGDTYTLTAADTLFFGFLTAVLEAGDRYEIWDGQTILWGSFPSGIKVTIGPLTAYTDPVSEAVGLDAPEVAGTPPEPSGMWGGGATEDLPMYDLFNTVAGNLGWTTDVLYVVAWFILSIGMGVALLVVTGSGLGAIAGVGVGMVGGMATGMLPVWVLIVYLVLAGTWLYTSRAM